MPRQRMAVIGVGALGRHHARILSQIEGVELVAVVDSRADQGRDVAGKCGTNWLADYQELLSHGAVDAVSVVVPTVAHWQVAGDFLRAGIPVLVEKPLAANVDQARELVRLAADNGALLQVGHIERFNPAFQVASQQIDKPKYIRAERTSPYTFRSTDIGVVHDLMIHDIELTQSLVQSEFVSVEAFGVSLVGGHEDAVQARVRFANGCIADLSANRVCPAATRTIQVWSAAGCVTADLHARTLTSFTAGPDLLAGQLPYELGREKGADINQLKSEMFTRFIQVDSPTIEAADALTLELRSFLDCIRTHTPPLVDGVAGLQAVKLAEAILKSVSDHRWDGQAAGAHGPGTLISQYGGQRSAA